MVLADVKTNTFDENDLISQVDEVEKLLNPSSSTDFNMTNNFNE